MRQPFDIVAYTYKADTYCVDCVVQKVAADLPNQIIKRNIRKHGSMYAEHNMLLNGREPALNWAADFLGIDRQDERSFDSGDFPKVVFRDQLGSGDEAIEYCGNCGRELG